MEMLWQATEAGIIRWSILKSDDKCVVPELGVLQAYEVYIGGIVLVLMPRGASIGATDGRPAIAVAMAASDKHDNYHCLSTDNRTIKGNPEPHDNYLVCLYLLARRQWTKRFMPDFYLKEYKVLNSGHIDLVPMGWDLERYFKPQSVA